jgi:protein SCO1/2
MKRLLSHLALLLCCAFPALADTATFSPKIPDVEVVTHEGKKVHFYSDLVKGNVVAVNFVFTNCSTICPVSGALFAALQKEHGRVHFISISIDPTVDTPQRLKSWSKQFRTQPGWTLVTGSPDAIQQLVRALGGPTGRPQDHQPLTLVGSDLTHNWSRLYGFPGSAKLGAVVNEVSVRR